MSGKETIKPIDTLVSNTSFKKKKKVFSKEELKQLPREELEQHTLQLMAHNTQLQALLRRTLAAAPGAAPTQHKHNKDRPFNFDKHPRRHVLLLFAYLGWDYQGYAVQEDTLNTIEHVLFDALHRTKLVQDRQTSNYHRCGRTDKGVSAFSQAISLTLRSKGTGDQQEIPYVQLLNRVLPKEVRMLAWCPVAEDFSARFDCCSRTYKYFFPRGALDIKRMRTAGKLLEGSHDFRNLCKMDVGNGVVNFQRTINKVTVSFLKDDHMEQLLPWKQDTIHDQNDQTHLNSNISDRPMDSASSTNGVSDKILDIYNTQEGNITIPSSSDPVTFASISADSRSPHSSKNEPNDEDDACDEEFGYSMCVVTIRSKAFLWHQMRAILAVLLMVGEGNEDPSVVSRLMDVESNPRKPQYSLASELPLCLFSTDYPEADVKWRYCAEALLKVHTDLQHLWAHHAIKSSMIHHMLKEISCRLSGNSNSQSDRMDLQQYRRQHACLTPSAQPRQYKPLLQRTTCESLETKVQHYVKRQRLDAAILDTLPTGSVDTGAMPATYTTDKKSSSDTEECVNSNGCNDACK